MTHLDFHAAILSDPDDDLVRLAFADWAEEQGESERAAWMRLSIDLAQQDADGQRVKWDAERAAFARCAPAWATAGRFRRGRGVMWASVATRDDVADLRRAWRPGSDPTGWLLAAELAGEGPAGAALAAGWRRRARLGGLPVRVVLDGPVTADGADALSAVLAFPALSAVEVRSRAAPGELGRLLAAATHANGVDVDLAWANPAWLSDEFDRFPWPPGLRWAAIRGRWNVHRPARPNDADISRLAGHPTLRRLRLVRCHGVTDAGVADLVARAPGLVVTRE